MQGTTRFWGEQPAWGLVHALAVLSLIGLALLGQTPGEVAGWWASPAQTVGLVRGLPAFRGTSSVRWRSHDAERGEQPLAAIERYLLASWPPVLLRSLGLWGLWAAGGCRGPGWLGLVPWVGWLWQAGAVGWPRWRQRGVWRGGQWLLGQSQRLLLAGYLGWAGSRLLEGGGRAWGVGLSCVVCGRDEPWVGVERQADGSYQATLCGHFTLAMPADHPFRVRLLILFLTLLDVPGMSRRSRRTRDGRTPFVRQMQLGAWFGLPHPLISRWLRYWHAADWANLLSLCSAEVLTTELVGRIVTVLASFPTWSQEQVYQHLRQQGVEVTQAQVAQAAQRSGWQQLWQTLNERYALGATTLRLRDEWLVRQLLAQVRDLLRQLEGAAGLPSEVQVAIGDLVALAATCGVTVPPPLKALPWLLRVEQVVLGQWQPVSDGQVHCPYCGSHQVARKSTHPRTKQYYDEAGQLRQVAVYRYYCRNPQCAYGSFTDLPPGLVPYSRYRTQTHLLAVQMYGWGYSTYRRTGTALGVASLTAWRWVSAWGYELLPVAALFGVVRCSGVVGVDEKYVLVPKNDKPQGEMRRWMYVYLAVDVWTYDLLHIALYPDNTEESAEAFLLALRAKGYRPQVVVTDLRQDYDSVIGRVFPQAVHHLCVFHGRPFGRLINTSLDAIRHQGRVFSPW
jgi:hypothetical protein